MNALDVIKACYLTYGTGGLGETPKISAAQLGWCYKVVAHRRRGPSIVESETPMSTEKSGTTEFMNDGIIEDKTFENWTSLDSSIPASASVTDQQSIKDFLAKPLVMSQGIWSTSDAVKANLLNITGLKTYCRSYPMITQKLVGFLGIRAKMVFRLQLNSNKFQQGRLLMTWFPVAEELGAAYAQHTLDLIQITQLPRVELDINCGTEMVFSIPYVSNMTHFNLIDLTGNNGRLDIWVYSPLVAPTGSTHVDFTLYCHLEDIEFAAPTLPWNIYTQAFTGRINKTDAEAKNSQSYPVSNTLSTLSTATSHLAKIPVLSSIAGTASWVTDYLAKGARAFGLSKPNLTDGETPVVRHLAPFPISADHPSTAYPLSVMSTNKLDVLPGFAGTDLDEMNLSSIVTKPAFFTALSWTTSQAAGTSLATWSLDPRNWIVSFSDTGPTVPQPYWLCAPVAMIGRMFYWYRGSLTFTFKFVRTAFHSGRLVLSYTPAYGSTTSPAPNIIDGSYTMREIIDIKEKSEFTFTLPYASTVPWRNSYYGGLRIQVLNDLVAPASVSSTVSILVEVSGADDMEFAFPTNNSLTVYCPSVNTQGSLVYTQMDSSNCQAGSKSDTVGNVPRNSPTETGPARFCIGEKITSIAQLMKRYCLTTPTFDGLNANVKYWDVRPFALTSTYGVTSAAVHRNALSDDLVSLFGQCFAFNRGGMRFQVYAGLTEINVPDHTFTGMAYGSTTTTIVETDLEGPALPITTSSKQIFGVMFKESVEGLSEVQIPAYNQAHARINRFTSLTPEPADIYGSQVRYQWSSDDGSSAVTAIRVKRAIADDYQLGFWLSTPPVLLPSPL